MSSAAITNKVEVLFDGYSRMESEGSSIMRANCTCSLVLGDGVKMIVDTMTPWDGPRILNALAERTIAPEEITHVVATHGHSDHIGNLNLFLKAKHIVGTSMNHEDSYYDVLQSGTSLKIVEGIEVVPTPGHTATCVSVIVLNTELGIVAVTGDLFEKRDDIFEPHIWEHLAGSENPLKQSQSRQKVLRIANHVVPGHGPMFEVTEEMRSLHDEYVRKMRSHYGRAAASTENNAPDDCIEEDSRYQSVNGNFSRPCDGPSIGEDILRDSS